jgi:hypothetical protein
MAVDGCTGVQGGAGFFSSVPVAGRYAGPGPNGVTIWGFGAAVCVLHVHIE